MNDSRKEMSVFLERQEVRRRRDFGKRLRQLERVLVSFVIVLAGLAAIYGIYLMVFMGSTFAVAKIVVEGKWSHLTSQGVAELSGVKEGDNLFWINIDEVKERLKQEPWISAAAVQRRLPGTLWIYVEEERPAAIVAAEDGLYFVNDHGVPFKAVEAEDKKDVAVITGLKISGGAAVPDADRERLCEMLKLAGFFTGSTFGRERDVSEIHYDAVAGYSIITKKEPVQILFGHTSFDERIKNLDKTIGAITTRPGRIKYMLANEPERIIVKYANS